MDNLVQIIITIITSVLASSGLWTFIQKRMEKKDIKSRMLLGLAHDRIMDLGFKYLDRGYVTATEYENLYDYLYLPYKEMGGNGSAEKLMTEVKKLPIRDN